MTAFDTAWRVSKGQGGPQPDCKTCKGTGYIKMRGITFRCERCPKWSYEK